MDAWSSGFKWRPGWYAMPKVLVAIPDRCQKSILISRWLTLVRRWKSMSKSETQIFDKFPEPMLRFTLRDRLSRNSDLISYPGFSWRTIVKIIGPGKSGRTIIHIEHLDRVSEKSFLKAALDCLKEGPESLHFPAWIGLTLSYLGGGDSAPPPSCFSSTILKRLKLWSWNFLTLKIHL